MAKITVILTHVWAQGYISAKYIIYTLQKIKYTQADINSNSQKRYIKTYINTMIHILEAYGQTSVYDYIHTHT